MSNVQTVKQLREIAKERSLRGYYHLKKADLKIEKLKESHGDNKPGSSYTTMKKTELLSEAKKRGLKGYSRLNKAGLIERLEKSKSDTIKPVPKPRPKPALIPRPTRPPPPPPAQKPAIKPDADFFPVEQTFDKTHGRYRIDGKDEISVDSFFNKIRQELVELIGKELRFLKSAKIQTIAWIQFIKEENHESVEFKKAFNSKMTEFHQGSNFEELIEKMFNHMKKQIENPALPSSGFVLDRVLYIDIDFHKLKLTRGSSYIPLPDVLAKKESNNQPQE